MSPAQIRETRRRWRTLSDVHSRPAAARQLELHRVQMARTPDPARAGVRPGVTSAESNLSQNGYGTHTHTHTHTEAAVASVHEDHHHPDLRVRQKDGTNSARHRHPPHTPCNLLSRLDCQGRLGLVSVPRRRLGGQPLRDSLRSFHQIIKFLGSGG